MKDVPTEVLKRSLGNLGSGIKSIPSIFSFFGKHSLKVAQSHIIKGDESLPKNFDSRTAWPGCVKGIRD